MTEKPKVRSVRVGPLDSIAACRRELGRCYRAARNGKLEVDQLRAFCYVLKELREGLTACDLEARLEQLEAANE